MAALFWLTRKADPVGLAVLSALLRRTASGWPAGIQRYPKRHSQRTALARRHGGGWPHKTLYNRFVRWSRLGVFNCIFDRFVGSAGEPERLMIDATHLKAHNQDLDLFRIIADTVSDGVVVTSADLDHPGPRIEYVNAAFTRITAYGAEEVLGKSPRMFQGPGTDRVTLDRLRTALEQGKSFFGTAVNYRKDGTEYVNEWLINPSRNAEGRIVRWVSAQRDVTDQVRSEASQQLLLGELNHRVMNNLAAVQSMAARLGRSASSTGEFQAALQERLFALAKAQKTIVAAHWKSIPLGALAQAQLAPFGIGNPGRVEASGPQIHLRAGAAVILGLALHELGLNALKQWCPLDTLRPGRAELVGDAGLCRRRAVC